MDRLSIATIGCGKLTSNGTYFADIWFSYVKTLEYAMAAGVDYCGPAKTSQKCFCLATLENFMKDWSGGSYPFMMSTPRVTGGRPLLDIGYN